MAKSTKTRKLSGHISGVNEVIKLIESLGDASLEALDKASLAGAQVVYDASIGIVPESTGKLKSSIRISPVKSKNKSKFAYTVGPRDSKSDGMTYSAPVELGYETKSGKRIKENPFMRRALDHNKSRVVNVISIAFSSALKGVK